MIQVYLERAIHYDFYTNLIYIKDEYKLHFIYLSLLDLSMLLII